MKVKFAYYEEFFHIAIDNYKKIIKLEKEIGEIQVRLRKSEKFSDDLIDKIAEKNDRIGRLALIVIIFCATSLEAYINDYAIFHLSKNYLKTYLDKLDLFSKWIVIPRITRGIQLEAGARPFQDLSWLISVRNKLVHHKTRTLDMEQIKDTDFLWADDAKRAIETVKNLAQELKIVDSDIHVEWTTKSYDKYLFFNLPYHWKF
jgi:hypothetical protein